jgi:HAD superfamily hydrolase (TIGR01490 family)
MLGLAMEAAFFDLDKTVIARASMVAFGRPMLAAGFINRWLLLRALWSQLVFHYFGADEERMRKFRESALRITRGWDRAKISALVRETLVDVIEPLVYDEALELIEAHRRAGRRVFIVSASPEEIVVPLAGFLGVDGAIATRARVDEHGRYTGEVDFYSYGPFKADAMREIAAREGLDLGSSFAYSDSITDLPMLEAVGHPVAVNPDRDLARIARERGWEIRWFRHGVPLRERVPMPAPRTAALLAGATALTGAGLALVWWWIRRQPPPAPSGWQRWRRAATSTAAGLAGHAASLRRPAASSPRTRRARRR